MESITSTDLLIFFGFGLAILTVSILAVLFEESDKTIGRLPFLGWMAALLLLPGIGNLAGGLFAGLAVSLALTYPVMQRYVQRARDAGMSKTIAFLSIIPLVSLITSLILLIAPGVSARISSEAPAVFSNAG
ncbi:DUF805 domain-containing protein [Denitrobaculum tricleocarpae]|uniref:DUF805 domain-containing protein n=1 Tax=Denitrobaculum tricleocarpae TaxID=2591009 RepID=A0A545TT68_9PROT|nr:DUF805 domain-containing protein [Denitrobaculum tricleocarpae]TQV80415.1 DUF805 domain-containing protein [Denitrobaculum tricleocarpae]